MDQNHAADSLGNTYYVHRQEVAAFPGWHLVHLNDLKKVREKAGAVFLKASGFIVLAAIAAFGFIIFFLYIKTKNEIVQRKKAEEQRDRLILDLQKALADVNTLSGMLPICSSCKKIRDDEGYWNQIEGYIQKHSDAEFSHGICPDCAKKLYPDFDLYDEPTDGGKA